MNIQIGDVVQLKGGGPQMTVESLQSATGKLKCVWFDESKRMVGVFDPATLKKLR